MSAASRVSVKKVPIHLQSSQNRVMIKNGRVVNWDGVEQVDVYVEDGVVKQVGNYLIIPGGVRTIDAAGKYVIPGGVDANVHLQTPIKVGGAVDTVTIDDFYQGTKAAIAGGTTTVVDTVVPQEGETLAEAVAKWYEWAEGKACCDYAFKVALPSTFGADVARQMAALASSAADDALPPAEVAPAVNAFHVSMSGDRAMRDADLVEAFRTCKELGCLALVHAENGQVVERAEKRMLEMGVTGPEGFAAAHSEAAEEEAVLRAATLASSVNCPLYVTHVTGQASLEALRQKKSRGCVVFGEVTPAALACDGQEYLNRCWRHAAGFMCSPPLRTGQREELLEGVRHERGFDVVASDHATYTAKQKAAGGGLEDFTKVPLGVNGVEARMAVLWEKAVRPGHITPERFVELTSANPAKMFNLYPQKGRIEVGSDADLVIWDPNKSRTISKETHNLKVDFNIFEGMECHGVAETVIVQGKLLVDEGHLRVLQGFGRFLPLQPFSKVVYDLVEQREQDLMNGLEAIRPVARTGADFMIVRQGSHRNGGGDGENGGDPVEEDSDIPGPTPKKSTQAERAPSQQTSNFDLKNHPNEDADSPSMSSPVRSVARVRAPPGGKTSGGFW